MPVSIWQSYSPQPGTGQPSHREEGLRNILFSGVPWFLTQVNGFCGYYSVSPLHKKPRSPSDSGIQILLFRCLKFRKYSSEPIFLLWSYLIVAHKLNFKYYPSPRINVVVASLCISCNLHYLPPNQADWSHLCKTLKINMKMLLLRKQTSVQCWEVSHQPSATVAPTQSITYET